MTEFAIRITRLHYSYPDGTKALDGIDLDVRLGERIGIVGPSGSGKSTLLLHLNGILSGNGTVRIMGKVVESGSLREVRRHVGLVFQDPHDQLFCPTVFEDVAFGLLSLGVPESEIVRRVDKALLDSCLGLSIRQRSPRQLSLGECERVALATVLVMEPAILVLDDPGGHLDSCNRRRLIDTISRSPGTVVLASHDLEMVLELCPRAVVMDQGKIWADGNTRTLLSDRQLMEGHGLEVPPSLRHGLSSEARPTVNRADEPA